MSSLRDLQRRFAQRLVADDAAEAGIAVYRHAIRANYRNALAATYGVVRELTGAPFFNAAVDAYARADPPRTGDLNVFGDTFGDFLAGYEPARSLPYLPDVARLEWAIDDAQRAADAHGSPQRVLEDLAGVPADQVAALRFVVDPSCRLLHSPYAVWQVWHAHWSADADLAAVDVAAGPDDLIVRRAGEDVAIARLPPAERAWLAALAKGDDLASALDAAFALDADFDVATALRTRIADGTLTAVTSR
jgi:hypothetical protein